MKKIFATLALAALATAASATTISADYGYTRATNSPYIAGHAAVVSVKQAVGTFGNVKLGLGTVQGVTNSRDNGTVFGLEYSYDFTTPIGQLSPAVSVQRITGTAGGNVDTYAVGATLRTPVYKATRLVTTASHIEGANGLDTRATSAGIGAEYDLNKALVLKAGYVFTRAHTANRNLNGLAVGVDYKF